jgi:cysteine desulfurase
VNARIDLDAHATTPLSEAARAAMLAAPAGNPSSAHAAGRRARQSLDDSRESIAADLDCFPDEIIFTSGATESNNLAVFGLAGNPSGTILASPIEHPCILEPLKQLQLRGGTVAWAGCDPQGCVGWPTGIDYHYAILMLANHETGAIQPVREWVRALPGVPVHTDAAQAVGKIPVSFRALGVATLSLSGHKFGGPVGSGALLVRRGITLIPRQFGGPQQGGRRAGTESAMLAAGLAAALRDSVRAMPGTQQRLHDDRQAFLNSLLQHCAPVHVNGPTNGLPGALNVSFPGCRADILLTALDLAGIGCSTGSACASGSLTPSPVLRAMGLPEELLRSAIRFTFGRSLNDGDALDAARRVATVVQRVRQV